MWLEEIWGSSAPPALDTCCMPSCNSGRCGLRNQCCFFQSYMLCFLQIAKRGTKYGEDFKEKWAHGMLYWNTSSLVLVPHLCQKWRKIFCDLSTFLFLWGKLVLKEDGNLINSLSLLMDLPQSVLVEERSSYFLHCSLCCCIKASKLYKSKQGLHNWAPLT